MLIFLASIALAQDSDTDIFANEIEPSEHGDTAGTARTALDIALKAKAEAEAASAAAAVNALRSRDVVRILKVRKAPADQIDAAEAEAEVAQQQYVSAAQAAKDAAEAAQAAAEADADRAESAQEDAAEHAKKAETARDDARDSAERAETAEKERIAAAALEAAKPQNADEEEHELRPYAAVGAGAGWMFRQESYGKPDMNGIRWAETTELSSGMLDTGGEVGLRDFGPNGRFNVGIRGTAAYNVGGGYMLDSGVVLGTFVDTTHIVKVGLVGGMGWETIPTDRPGHPYADRRWLGGLQMEFVTTEHVGLLLEADIYPDNDPQMDGSNAGRMAAMVRARF